MCRVCAAMPVALGDVMAGPLTRVFARALRAVWCGAARTASYYISINANTSVYCYCMPLYVLHWAFG